MSGTSDNAGALEAAVWDALRSVVDPELGGSLVDLGMICSEHVAGTTVTVELALTMPGCPLADWLKDQIRTAVLQIPGIQAVDVHIVERPRRSFPGAPWQHWLDEALAPNDDQRRRVEPEQAASPQPSRT